MRLGPCCDYELSIMEFTKNGIRAEDGKEHIFDIFAICTEYDAVTGGSRTMSTKGKDGRDLDEKWEEGVATNLGMVVNGYPNFFVHNTSIDLEPSQRGKC